MYGITIVISEPSVMSHEDRRKYRQLESGLMAAHKPRDEFERMVVQQLAHANWELRRVQATGSEFWEHMGGSHNRGNAGIAEGLLQENKCGFARISNCG